LLPRGAGRLISQKLEKTPRAERERADAWKNKNLHFILWKPGEAVRYSNKANQKICGGVEYEQQAGKSMGDAIGAVLS
jgi:hypothetical protein